VPPVTQPSTDDSISIQLEEPTPGAALLRVTGEVDMLTSSALRTAIADALGAGRERLVVDLDGVEFLGTSGLAALVEARSEAERLDTELWLVCSSRRILRPLEIAGLVDLFRIADTRSAALSDRH
jgi:anti-sigma B factor antagonist